MQGIKPKGRYKPQEDGITPRNITLDDIPRILPFLSPAEQEILLLELDKLESMKQQKEAQTKFLPFVKKMWPSFIAGRHHAKMAEAFERVARGELKRLIINMPPRHTKSEFASYLLPAWFLGQYPGKKIIQTSHTAELAVGFGRKVRNLVDTDNYHETFPDLVLQADSKAAGRWNTSKGGDYFAIGVGGAVTGKGADLLIIDDPHSEQEAALAEINPDIYDKTYEWYTSGPRQRLQPGGAIVIVMCMTGDTPVLRPDGSETPLRDLRPGDAVATYENGKITTSRVVNHQSSGVDRVFTVQTQSGRTVRANVEHPFLVEYNGVRKWARLKHLVPGMQLVGMRTVPGPHGLKPDPACATRAKPKKPTTARTPERHINPWASMVSGREKRVGAERRYAALAYAGSATKNSTPLRQYLLRSAAPVASSPGTGSRLSSTTTWSWRATTGATCAENSRLAKTRALTGTVSFVSTIATTLGKFAASCATTATSWWATVRTLHTSNAALPTCGVTPDIIISIAPSGDEEVFDVEIERTENFIANGLVSHNTRWSKRDLTAQVLKAAAQRGGEEWEVIEFPAILPSGNPLWPEFWPMEELKALKEELPNSKWMAQYQQNPTSDSAAIIKREWWQVWDSTRPPKCEFILTAWDTAFEAHQRADYSACTTWGVFYRDNDDGKKQANIILLNAYRARLEFPALKREFIRQYKEWEPDGIIVEKKASGAPLIYEMRAAGIPVQEFTPTRGNDKISRLNAVSDIFASGRVWMPGTHWAEEVAEEVASFPGGEHDDYCFVAGTLIATPRGDVPIEDMRAGDEVITPAGIRKVTAAGFTGVKPVITRVGLTGTGNHPVYVVDTGWVPLDTVTMADELSRVTLCDILRLQPQIQSSSTALSTGVWGERGSTTSPSQTPTLGAGVPKGFMSLFGSTMLVPWFRSAMRSTISTVTRSISILKTLSAYQKANTAAYRRSLRTQKQTERASPSCAPSPQSGTAQKKDGRGIGRTHSTVWQLPELPRTANQPLWDPPVLGAEERLQRRTLEGSSAAPLAEGTTTATPPADARQLTPTICPVYNLTVEDAHCYYANGILVHNCDTVSMALMRFRKGGYVGAAVDEEDDDYTRFRPISRGYY